ncbi:branched-chain amino acid permease [Amycolatopsis antarctica]|uniref:Branched-chain amino acid permease n=1 Tax=Amycolatopsis antarctica TaxID=1854586 RepID=A0A263D1W7_9PSEU|nr:AzlC family ABC transporter permease [Amycolatopsis antarctica]OZM72450.1 branched-chain amino acid permease [Amycolatopsis antarctica]
MRSLFRTLDRGLLRDIALVCLADAIVGLSYGAIAVGEGFDLWLPMLMSVLVFGGASQFIFIGIVGSGGNPIAGVVAGLLVNARHLPFGFAVAELLGSGLRRLVGTHLMIDEAVAFALAQKDFPRRRAAYWATGIGLFVCWNAGVLAGGLAGSAISDTDLLGLDAAFPAVLLALLLPSLRDAGARRAAVAGVAVALATTPFLPAGLPVLLALAGVLVSLGSTAPGTGETAGDPAVSGRHTEGDPR